ncbi:MAG: hypothetical protein IKM17_09830 [Lentisphaeria bacterium]|nr:hypothetical protein [Lentisphaeria bacterium]
MDGDQIQYLMELLDDDNEQSVQLAMAALLKSDDASLDSCLSELQQSRSARLRKRVRQLETALKARRNRSKLEMRLKRSSLLEGCVQLHLCWFDNDQAELVYKQWNDLLADYRIRCGGRPSLASAADFMAKKEFHAPMNDDLAADFYCLGIVLEDKYGSDLLLAIITAELLRAGGVSCAVARYADDFCVMDRAGNLVLPAYDWRYCGHDELNNMYPEIVADPQLLRYLGAMLLTCAVGSDSYRYVYTIGRTISTFLGQMPDCGNAFLPYPYCSLKNDQSK